MEEQNEKACRGSVARGLARRRGGRADGRHQGIDIGGCDLWIYAAGTRGPSPAARRRRAEREEPERPERSSQQGKSGARQEDQEHLPRLLRQMDVRAGCDSFTPPAIVRLGGTLV